MKILLAILLPSVAAVAQEPTQEELKTAKTIDLAALDQQPDLYAGQVIKLRFNYRWEQLNKGGDSWSGTIGQWSWGPKRLHATCGVTFPEDGRQWFLRIATDTDKARTGLVWGRVKKDAGFSRYTIELLGREAKTGANGIALAW